MQPPSRRQQVFNFPGEQGQLFATYVGNDQVVQALKQLVLGQWRGCVYLWGESGTGKSHLLQAACMQAEHEGVKASYAAAAMEATANHGIVCVDDLHHMPRQQETELELLSCYERLQARAGSLLVAADVPPSRLQLRLADVRSRLAAGLVFKLAPLDDAGRMQAMQRRLRARSMVVSDEILGILLRRLPRDMRSLCRALDDMVDFASSQRQRLTPTLVHRYIARLSS